MQLKELQLYYGPAIWWKLNYPGKRIRIVVETDGGSKRTFIARLSNGSFRGGHPDMVTSIVAGVKGLGKERSFYELETFKKAIIAIIEKT